MLRSGVDNVTPVGEFQVCTNYIYQGWIALYFHSARKESVIFCDNMFFIDKIKYMIDEIIVYFCTCKS